MDESTTLSKKSTLIIFVRVCLANRGMDYPVKLILDLIELQIITTNGVFQASLDCLQLYGMKTTVLAPTWLVWHAMMQR
jgi:hypothetical protein